MRGGALGYGSLSESGMRHFCNYKDCIIATSVLVPAGGPCEASFTIRRRIAGSDGSIICVERLEKTFAYGSDARAAATRAAQAHVDGLGREDAALHGLVPDDDGTLATDARPVTHHGGSPECPHIELGHSAQDDIILTVLMNFDTAKRRLAVMMDARKRRGEPADSLEVQLAFNRVEARAFAAFLRTNVPVLA